MFYAYVPARSLEASGAFERELVNRPGGSLPLMTSEVVAERSRLGLPQ